MEVCEVVFTKMDRMVMQSYATLLDGLEEYLGEGYEIVLHSLESLEHSVIKIVNGHHTGRKPGAPITEIALSMLGRLRENPELSHISYFTKNKNGDPLKACTIAIKGESDKVIGMLCINFYLNTPVSKLISTLSAPVSTQPMLLETFGESTSELIEQAVAQARTAVMNDHTITQSLKNREIVSILHAQGIFKIKNAVELVADEIGISKNTVYLHLRNISN